MTYQSAWMNPELSAFREQFRRFLASDLAPRAEGWRKAKMVDRAAWRALGDMGALLPSVPEAYGGIGGTFAHEAAVAEDIVAVVPELGTGVSVHSAIVAHYIVNYGSHEQKLRWLPKMARGEFIGAIAAPTCRLCAQAQGRSAIPTPSTAKRPSSPMATPPIS
jgi:acyl-CoA dehydrogenase